MDVIVIGAGFIGKLHKAAWERSGARVAAIVDPYLPEERRAAYRSEGVCVADSIAAAVRECPTVAAASVCTPPNTHLAALRELLACGLPVLMEKPVATKQADYEAMLSAVESAGGRVMIGLTQRFYPEVRKAAEWIRTGRIGRPIATTDIMILDGSVLPSWYYDLEVSGGGVLLTNGVHLLDRLQYLMDSELAAVDHCDFRFDGGGIDHLATLSGRLASGAAYRFHAEWSRTAARQETIVFGAEGRIELQTWGYARLFASDGVTEEFRAYQDTDDFDAKTLKGLTLEVQAFMEGLRSPTGFAKGLSLQDHWGTMRTIWDCYAQRPERREGR